MVQAVVDQYGLLQEFFDPGLICSDSVQVELDPNKTMQGDLEHTLTKRYYTNENKHNSSDTQLVEVVFFPTNVARTSTTKLSRQAEDAH